MVACKALFNTNFDTNIWKRGILVEYSYDKIEPGLKISFKVEKGEEGRNDKSSIF